MGAKVVFSLLQQHRVLFSGARDMERRPAEHARGDVADAFDRVAPAAIRILVSCQPGETPGNESAVVARGCRMLLNQCESAYRRCR